jgi:predicted permease
MILDIKYAFRLLFKDPKFTAMSLGVLIGGLSISLFTFSFLYTMVYKPLPIPEAETAKAIGIVFDGQYNLISAYEYDKVKDIVTSFAELGVYENQNIRLSVKQSGKNISGSYVQDGFFEFSRVKPILGRTIQAQDTKIGANPVVVISHETWQHELNGDKNVLNQPMILNGQLTSIIGVMPKGYHFPNTSRVWLPLSDNTFNVNPKQSSFLNLYGRMQPNITLEAAEAELGQAVNQIYQQNVKRYNFPETTKSAKIVSFQIGHTFNQGTMIFAFLNGLSWIIFLLACINIGNLLLARTLERQKETAIRAALGASTSRLVSQLMWEGIIISCLGGVLSILLVGAALDYVEMASHGWLPHGGAYWWHWGMDLPTLLVALAFTGVTILLSSFLPAWRSARQDINSTLRDGTRGAQSKKAGRISRFLVTMQIFLVATLMLVGATTAFFTQTFIHLDMGDDYQNVMRARMTIPEKKYPEIDQQLALFQKLKANIEQNPQVQSVVANELQGSATVTISGLDYASEESKPKIDTITVIGSMATVGVRLVAGRDFTHIDKAGNRKTALISQSMAKRYWPGESPLEKSFHLKIDDKDEKVVIVGVVTDRLNPRTLFAQLDSDDEIYLSGLQFFNKEQIVYYRISANTKNAAEIFYQALFAIDHTIKVNDLVQPADRNRNATRDVMNVMSDVTFVSGFFALLLAMVGIYGLTSNSVSQRTHEIGIRRAVGASDRQIIAMFIKQVARQLIIGLGLGLILFVFMATGFHNFTERLIPVHNYFILASFVVVGLTLVVTFAIYVPTKRAVNMEPSEALRYE